MAGDPALIGLASRQISTRPLTEVRKIEAEARQRLQERQAEVEEFRKKMTDTRAELKNV